jgi:DNA modification methylase
MKTITVKINEVKSNPNNPRIIKDDKFKKLVASIKELPQMLELRPIVVNEDMIVLGGNMRLKACKEAGLKEIPIIKASELNEEQQRAFIIKDNVGFGEWDWDALANEWDAEQLDEWGLDVPNFEGVELDAVEDDFDAPEGGIETDIVIGDLFEIGEHRLLCGSSTEADAVNKLLNGNEPYLMITDPPYGVNYKPEWRSEAMPDKNDELHGRSIGKVKNDNNADWTEAWALTPAKVAYVYHAGIFSGVVQKSLEDCDFEIRSQIIWMKSHFAISRADYHWKHEPCWYAVKKGNKGNWISDRKQTTIWEIDKPQKNETGHSTQKPIECMAKAIANHEGDVHDPFLGSGTTMVAAHQLNRKCYGMELDPKYCQVIIDRMLKLDPSLSVKRNGETYAKTEQ